MTDDMCEVIWCNTLRKLAKCLHSTGYERAYDVVREWCGLRYTNVRPRKGFESWSGLFLQLLWTLISLYAYEGQGPEKFTVLSKFPRAKRGKVGTRSQIFLLRHYLYH